MNNYDCINLNEVFSVNFSEIAFKLILLQHTTVVFVLCFFNHDSFESAKS